MQRALLTMLVILCIEGYTAIPSWCQSRAEMKRLVERAEVERKAASQTWASSQGLPIRLSQTRGGIAQLVGLDARRPIYLSTLNQTAARATKTYKLHPGAHLGLQLTGRGRHVGIWDGGLPLRTHQEYEGRITIVDRGSSDDHATHVAGTLVASGIRTDARGMAYEASLRAFDWENDSSEMIDEASRGLLVSNHSYGVIAGWFYGNLEDQGDQWYWLGDANISTTEDYLFGWYDAEAVQFDRVTFSNPYLLPVVAAGNDRDDRGPRSGSYRALNNQGVWQSYQSTATPRPQDGGTSGYDTIAGAAVAKNVLTVGSIRLNDASEPVVSDYSSFGPTDDGRIKPDLVGYGEDVFSTLAGNPGAYGFSSGTSMATPNVTGTLLLLQEHFHNLTGRHMRAATLKGLALHTADDIGPPGPDYQFGWGLLNAEKAALVITESVANTLRIEEIEIEDGTSVTRLAKISEAGPLRITLSWTDRPDARLPLRGPESLDDPTSHLQNDLDLRLIYDATGQEIYPFVLNGAAPASPASRGDNRVDPIEQIYLPHSEPGTYSIRVSHKDQLVSNESQPFTLIVTGAETTIRPVALSHEVAEGTVEKVDLRWKTQYETEEGVFIIKRARALYDKEGNRELGPQSIIGEIPTRGIFDAVQDYAFEESHVPSGSYVYQIFFQGAESFFLASELEVFVPPPQDLIVLSSYPNPFSNQATLVFDFPKEQHLSLTVYDALGRQVESLFEGEMHAGRHTISIDASTWAPGLYFVRLTTPESIQTHHLVVIR